ncbi:MAG: geranylgeranylglyceryl/heptaprenylglyceryl phosphate synthase [Candidatus Diapherotrites archaeon]|nr:geranylgeranylglyceryl/heptaprenylglyceryl phosphate synthase [Candidatus Diapherotrites archaeon]
MKMGKVEKHINSVIENDGVCFFGLIDPPKREPRKALDNSKAFYEAGADVILIGGSTGAQGYPLEQIARLIKEEIDLPILLFPGNVGTITSYADAIYYYSLMNSVNPYWITGAPALGAPVIKRLGIEAIPTSLIVVDPGETVGWVGQARPIPRHKPDLAAAYALAGQYLGSRMTILEAGSGAPAPPPAEMFAAIKSCTDIPVICAGSSKDLKDIERTVRAGADGIHIASMIEKSNNPFEKAKEIVSFTKKIGRENR